MYVVVEVNIKIVVRSLQGVKQVHHLELIIIIISLDQMKH